MSFLRNFLLFLLLVSGITFVIFMYLHKPVTGIDDANIFFTYARNIANGEGFVFNAGGERVEGFTSFLWVLVCASCFYLCSQPEWVLMAICLLLTTASVTIIYRELKKDVDTLNLPFSHKYFLILYCAFLVCIGPSFFSWSVLSLMENSLWNLLFITLACLILRAYRVGGWSFSRQVLFVISGMLFMLTRPEAIAWGLFFTLLLALVQYRNGKSQRFTFIFFLLIAGVATVLILFRLDYFGFPFPNTYYAKVSHDLVYNFKSGLGYAIGFITAYHAVITLLIVLLLIVTISSWKQFRSFTLIREMNPGLVLNRIMIVTLIVTAAIVLPVITGGDHFGGFRFYQNILLLLAWGLPALLLLFQEGVQRRIPARLLALGSAIVVFFFLVGAGSLYVLKRTPKTQLIYEFQLAVQGRNVAKAMNELWKAPYPKVGVVAAGGFGLKYQGTTIDLMGLNNILMGHSPGERTGFKNHAAFNKDVFYQLGADLIFPRLLDNNLHGFMLYGEYINKYNFENVAMKGIFNDTFFQSRYKPVIVGRKNGGQLFFAFASMPYLEKMRSDNRFYIKEIVFD